MGLEKGKTANYWSTNSSHKKEVAPSIMLHNRLPHRLRYICFGDNETIDLSDQMRKNQAMSIYYQQFQKLFTHEESIVIDESLVSQRKRHYAYILSIQ